MCIRDRSPNSGGVSLRTFNRNFEGRSGTADAQVYLVNPETAAASALTGVFTDPRTLGEPPVIEMPAAFEINDNMIVPPAPEEEMEQVEILRGPNIKPFPKTVPLPDSVEAKVMLKVGDNIPTDHIMPAGAKILPLRSNIPAISEYCFTRCDPAFPARCKAEDVYKRQPLRRVGSGHRHQGQRGGCGRRLPGRRHYAGGGRFHGCFGGPGLPAALHPAGSAPQSLSLIHISGCGEAPPSRNSGFPSFLYSG